MSDALCPHYKAVKDSLKNNTPIPLVSSNCLLTPNQSLSQEILASNPSLTFAAHADDLDIMDWKGMTYGKAMFAGAVAGVSEHIFMFPVDTVKTRMQVSTKLPRPSFASTLVSIVRNERIFRLYRGLPAAIYGAIPAHAVSFAAYEYTRKFTGASRETYTPLANLLSGVAATMSHDAIGVPMDVVKQRMQISHSPYTSVTNCITSIVRREGLKALYSSYLTTLVLNIPYMCTYFTIYEGLQTIFHNYMSDYHLLGDFASGGIAGGIGGFISTPLDVIKTRLQTQIVESHGERLNSLQMTKEIYSKEGLRGFTRGAVARMMLFMPSAAICWSVYEALKRVLPDFNPPDHEHEHEHEHHHKHH